MKNETKEINVNSAEQIAVMLDEMVKPLGSNVAFKTLEDFEKSIESGEPLVLKWR